MLALSPPTIGYMGTGTSWAFSRAIPGQHASVVRACGGAEEGLGTESKQAQRN